jgi:cardiolipin synthase
MVAGENEPIERQPQSSQRDTRLERALTRVSNAPLRSGNALTLLQDGPATYEDWLAAIRQAQRWIHLDNYIFKNDTIGYQFAEALAERAAAGVKVRVLYDWFGSLDVPNSFWRFMRKRGIDVRAVNPLWVGAPLEAFKRDHRKYLGVDGIYASLGGVCIADPWLASSPVTGLPYRDTSVRVTGPAIFDLEQAFATIWNNQGAPLPADETPLLHQIPITGEIEARVIAQEPERLRMIRTLQLMLAGVEQRIWIADAYFLATGILREAIMAAARDGVDVRILLPSTNDVFMVGPLSRYGYRPLLQSGVRIWEYAGPMMHAKTIVADGWWARVGSTNMNITGLLTNWEIDLVAEDRQFAQAMEQMYEEDLSHAREILGGIRGPRPTRPESQAERAARLHKPKRRNEHSASVARVSATLQAVSKQSLLRNERMIGGGLGSILVLVAVLSARFPKAIAWPLALILGLLGSLGLVRALSYDDDDE